MGAHGDLPGEFKFQYGAAVLHGSALDQSHYAIHGSLFVLVPDDDSYRLRAPFRRFRVTAVGRAVALSSPSKAKTLISLSI